MNFEEFHGGLQRFALVSNEADIAELCWEYAANLGFGSFIYALRLPTSFAESRVVQIRGYPEAWLDRYWERGYYAIDPVIAYCSRHTLPVAWHALTPETSRANRRVMNEATEFGLRSGVSMPMHGPRGELGILSFAEGSATKAGRETVAMAMPYVQLLAGYLHEAVRRAAGSVEETPPTLSAREEDCLRWASDGKTSWEIARLLNISERTVNFHFNNAMTKLNATSRQHAIAKAISLCVVRPRPF